MKLSEEETLIDLWQQKPCLYDISNQSYSNKNKKKLDMRSVERGMFPITTSTINELFLDYNYGRMHCACTKRPYFHFSLKSNFTIVLLDPDFF